MKHYRVNSKEEAWSLVNKLFPTDYMKDTRKSDGAGYPAFTSTNMDNWSWISDLGCRIELNICEECSMTAKTTTIWIDDRHPLEKAGFKKNTLGIWVAA